MTDRRTSLPRLLTRPCRGLTLPGRRPKALAWCVRWAVGAGRRRLGAAWCCVLLSADVRCKGGEDWGLDWAGLGPRWPGQSWLSKVWGRKCTLGSAQVRGTQLGARV